MTTRKLVMVSAAIEMATGVALLAVPELVAPILLGAELTGSGVAVARVGGFGLLALGLSCWPGTDDANAKAIRALVVYNLLPRLSIQAAATVVRCNLAGLLPRTRDSMSSFVADASVGNPLRAHPDAFSSDGLQFHLRGSPVSLKRMPVSFQTFTHTLLFLLFHCGFTHNVRMAGL
jgi:hypothetical protein